MATQETNPPELVLICITALLFIWTTLFTAVRCWAKSSQDLWSFFDAIFMAAFIICAGQNTSVFLAVSQHGFGANEIDVTSSKQVDWMKALYASDIMYILSIGLSRCSTAFFLSSLTRDQRQKTIGVVIATLAGTWTVASVFVVAIRGDLSNPWASLQPPFERWVGVEASGLVLELACWIFAVNLVWTLNMPLLRRLKLIFIFAMRLLLVPVIAVRLNYLSPSTFHGTTDDMVMVLVFTQTAMHFALISECLTCLRPFMQTFHEGLAPGNSNNYWGGLSHGSNPGMSNASGAEKDIKKHMRASAKQLSSDEHSRSQSGYNKRRYKGGDNPMHLRSDHSGFSTRVEGRRQHHDDEWTSGGDDDIELLPTNRSIHVKQTMTISSH